MKVVVVVDSNIVYSAILNTNSTLAKILLNPSERIQFCTVEYLKEEIEGHKVRIMEVSGFSNSEFQQNRDMLYEHISFFAEALIPFEIWQKAAFYVRDVDMDDIAFVALSLYMDCYLWTGDKKLKKAIESKGFTNGISTRELLVLIGDLDG